MRALPVAFDMEDRGITLHKARTLSLREKYKQRSKQEQLTCEKIGRKYGHCIVMPKGAMNDNLRELLLDVMELPPRFNKKAKSQEPTLNAEAMEYYLLTLPEEDERRVFIKALLDKRESDGMVGFLNNYQRFWLDYQDDIKLIHAQINPADTGTLRWSHKNPNSSNIGKSEDEDGFSLRSCFGPAPDREWWSLDAKNIELRIPFYESGEADMIALFEKENEPPYFGSNHILIFSILWEEIWEKALKEHGPLHTADFIKKTYKSSYYGWTKNGNFATQYQAGNETADLAYHQKGAKKKIESRFTKLADLNRQQVRFANKTGYVETVPDKEVSATRGYPLYCKTNMWGGVKPTIPLSYHVQGTAMWFTMKARLRCFEQLKICKEEDNFDARIVLQVHDELVFDMTKTEHTLKNPKKSNLVRIHETVWSKGVLV